MFAEPESNCDADARLGDWKGDLGGEVERMLDISLSAYPLLDVVLSVAVTGRR